MLLEKAAAEQRMVAVGKYAGFGMFRKIRLQPSLLW
jgi:hypothetical protein